MDLGRSPVRVFFSQTADQAANLLGNLGPTATRPGPPTPVQSKAGAMPANHGRRLHNYQSVGPSGPESAKDSPEKPIAPIQLRTRTFAFEDGELLSQCQDFERSIASTAQKDSERGDQGKD
jgi:hypothetical protein